MIPTAIIQMDSKHCAILIFRSFLVISFFISLPLANHPRPPCHTRQPKQEVTLSISSPWGGCSLVKRKRGLDTGQSEFNEPTNTYGSILDIPARLAVMCKSDNLCSRVPCSNTVAHSSVTFTELVWTCSDMALLLTQHHCFRPLVYFIKELH